MRSARFALMVLAAAGLGCGGGGYGGTDPNYPGGGGGGGGGGGSANTILIQGGSFSPDSINVAVGTAVTFTNNNTGTHNVVFTGNAPTGGNIPNHASGSSSRTFTAAGRAGIECTIHGFVGVIRVQ